MNFLHKLSSMKTLSKSQGDYSLWDLAMVIQVPLLIMLKSVKSKRFVCFEFKKNSQRFS